MTDCFARRDLSGTGKPFDLSVSAVLWGSCPFETSLLSSISKLAIFCSTCRKLVFSRRAPGKAILLFEDIIDDQILLIQRDDFVNEFRAVQAELVGELRGNFADDVSACLHSSSLSLSSTVSRNNDFNDPLNPSWIRKLSAFCVLFLSLFSVLSEGLVAPVVVPGAPIDQLAVVSPVDKATLSSKNRKGKVKQAEKDTDEELKTNSVEFCGVSVIRSVLLLTGRSNY